MKIIIANWKANPNSLEQAQDLFLSAAQEAARYPNVTTVICPPFVFIEELSKILINGNFGLQVNLGAQDLFWEKSGPFTGEISASMLRNFSVSHVLVGHSDRRYVMGETDEIINRKIKAAIAEDIMPILLVGEKTREEGRKEVIQQQLSEDLSDLNNDQISKVLIAYEPVWAISTTQGAVPDTPESTLEAIKIIDEAMASSYGTKNKAYLYGGSVNQNNVLGFLSHPEISGAVVGSASLKKEDFGEILRVAASFS